MKYLLLKSGKEKYWFELESNDYATRQIILGEDEEFHISCLEDCLAEGPIHKAELDGNIIDLTAREFERRWQLILKKYAQQWEKIKNEVIK